MSVRFILERTSDPKVEPFSVAELKRYLRMYEDQHDEDTDVANLAKAAREWAEDFTGRALVTQRWRLSIGDRVAVDPVVEPGVYCGRQERLGTEIYLRRTPVTSIVSFVSVDSDGDETAVDADTYELRDGSGRWPRVVALNGASWATGEYRIVFEAGYAEGKVPARLRQAMKLWAEANYERDDRTMQQLLDAAERLAKPERVDLGFS